MMRVVMLAIVLLVIALPVRAQDPEVRRQGLQQQVVERFLENYRAQAALSDDQYSRLREVIRQSFQARGDLNRRERGLWQSLEGQMRPGVAADEDSVTTLLGALLQVQAARVEHGRTDQQEYATFLSPVQRAQLTLAWRRLQNQIERVVRERMQDRPRRRPQ